MEENETARRRTLIEDALDAVLPKASERPAVLGEAMRWAVEGGGKRIRPLVCLAAAEAVGGRLEDALFPACAIELLHSYTLIHDDLPAMDNDAMRRGRASVWAKFGEANAILAGDALQALAFQTVARAPRNVPALVAELGLRGVGVVAGQVEDIAQSPRPLLHLRTQDGRPLHGGGGDGRARGRRHAGAGGASARFRARPGTCVPV